MLCAYLVARTIIERHIKVRGEANPYEPEHVEYFEKRRCFAWRTYPVGKARAFRAGTDKLRNSKCFRNLIAGSPRPRLILEGLDPCEGKLSRTVLRGSERATAPGLPGMVPTSIYYEHS